MKFMQNVEDGEVGLENGAVGGTSEDWVKDFNTSKKADGAYGLKIFDFNKVPLTQ